MTHLIDVRELSLEFDVRGMRVPVLDKVSFRIRPGSTVALVGESGSGKSGTAQAMMGILPHNGHITGGEILLSDPKGTDAPVDIAVIETGMGGRWDATNVVDAPVAVITPIGIDHTEYLGGTIAEIAAEKAGIISGPHGAAETVAVIAAQPPEAPHP